jgi:hypothetical protein
LNLPKPSVVARTENRAFVTSDLMARYRRIAGDGREIIGASIWEELIRESTDLPDEERRDITGRLGEISDSLFRNGRPAVHATNTLRIYFPSAL